MSSSIKTASARAAGTVLLLVTLFVLWYVIASDYSDGIASGTYHLSQNGETSTLIIKPDHSFQQELNRSGKVQRAEGSWRRLGEGGIAFSKEFLLVSGQEPGADGTAYGQLEKRFGFLVSVALSQYHVLWYSRVDPSPANTVSGTYAGDEEGAPSTLILKPNHTFEQTVRYLADVKHANGTWTTSQNGDIVFSREFLKTRENHLGRTRWRRHGIRKDPIFKFRLQRLRSRVHRPFGRSSFRGDR
jgi:hypothetical protein